MRPTKKDFVIAAAIGLLDLLAMLVFGKATAAEPFQLSKPTCYLDALDYRYKLADGPDAIVWWCVTDTGLETNYRAGEVGGIREFLFRIGGAGKDLYAADKQIFIRSPTEREDKLVEGIEAIGEPRCVFTTTAKTTGVLDDAHVARKDEAGVAIRISTFERPSCWSWQVVGTKKYCAVTGKDTKGRDLPAPSYVPCKLVLAPQEGWQ